MKLNKYKFEELILNKKLNIRGLQTELYNSKGRYPIVDQGQNRIAGYTDDESVVLKINGSPVIVFGDHTRIFKYIDFDFALGADGVKIIYPNTDLINPYYFYLILKSKVIPSAGYNRHYKYLKKLTFNIPDNLACQRSISKELMSCISQVETIQQAALKQKEAASALQSAVLREVFRWRSGDKLPDDWEWKKIRDIAPVAAYKSKNTHADNQPTSFIPMENIDSFRGTIIKVNQKPYNEIKKGYTYFEENDVLFAKITPCMENGNCAIAKNLINGFGFGSTEFIVLKPKNLTDSELLYYFLRTEEFRKDCEDHFTGSAGQRRVSTDYVANHFIPWPKHSEKIKFIANTLKSKLNNIYKTTDHLNVQFSAIEALPASILREAFNIEKSAA